MWLRRCRYSNCLKLETVGLPHQHHHHLVNASDSRSSSSFSSRMSLALGSSLTTACVLIRFAASAYRRVLMISVLLPHELVLCSMNRYAKWAEQLDLDTSLAFRTYQIESDACAVWQRRSFPASQFSAALSSWVAYHYQHFKGSTVCLKRVQGCD